MAASGENIEVATMIRVTMMMIDDGDDDGGDDDSNDF